MNRKFLKKSPEELEQYLQFKRKHHIIPSKKGKGSFKRKKKYEDKEYNI